MCDTARNSKKTLYIVFIDYIKAYDKVNRQSLLRLLDQNGCSTTFVHALAKFVNGKGVIGENTFNQSIGVRLDSCMSCPLFTLYIDVTVNAINAA